MLTQELDKTLTEIRAYLEQGNVSRAIERLEELRPPERADIISDLDSKEQVVLLKDMDHSISADIVEDLTDQEAADLIADLPTRTAVRIIEQMEPDEAADLLGDLTPEIAQILLSKLERPEDIQPLLIHPDETAGGLMTSEFITLRPHMTVQQALRALRTWKPETEDIYYLFVVDESKRLSGVVNLRQLVIAEPLTRVEEIMDTEVISVLVGTDQEECANLMSRYDLLALPVVDHEKVLLGAITIDDMVDVLVSEATEDIQKLGGAQPLTQPYLKTSVISVTQKRIGWLLLLFLTESLTGTVLRHFEERLQAVVALSFFIPLLIGTGGNAGTQTTTTLTRALATGEIRMKDTLRALWHEARAGFLLGVIMAIVAYLRALTWGSDTALALTVSAAVFTIVLWANMLGSILPIVATRLRIDPAVVSGPVLSTLVDATGLFVYLSIAGWILGLS